MSGLKTLSRLAIALTACLVLNAAVTSAAAQPGQVKRSDEYGDFNPGDPPAAGSEWIKAIVINSPALRAEVKGNVKVEFQAPGMTAARALCWQQPTPEKPDPWGHDVNLDPNLKLDAQGNGAFIFPADTFPNGPLTIRIVAKNDETKKQDVRELQLYNTGGVVWKQGIPKTDPPAAKGMKLAFSDDFDGPLSISNNGKGQRYMAHTRGGDFSGYPFTGPESPKNPFSQKGTFLRIHAAKNAADPKDKGSTGLISPVDTDGNGFYAKAPLYMECRFTGQSAPGTWAAFWTCAKKKEDLLTKKGPCDELDVIEAYGGVGKGHPNGYGKYCIVSHFWGQKDAAGKPVKSFSKVVDMTQFGGKSSWSTTFHTYGVLVTETETAYYCDEVEVLRHPSNEISKTEGFAFLINYAIGGNSGWKIDLEREGYATDMWVDYVRVYQGEKK